MVGEDSVVGEDSSMGTIRSLGTIRLLEDKVVGQAQCEDVRM